MLYYIIRYSTILYYTTQEKCHTMLYSIVLLYKMLYSILFSSILFYYNMLCYDGPSDIIVNYLKYDVLCYILLYHTALYRYIPYYTIFFVLINTIYTNVYNVIPHFPEPHTLPRGQRPRRRRVASSFPLPQGAGPLSEALAF